MASLPGPLALVGSGEFLPAMDAVDRALLDGRRRRVAVLPTAAGPEGDASVGRWFRMAEEHYAAMDAEVVRVDVRDRTGALEPHNAARIDDVGLIYLSGGNPGHLAESLRDTPVGAAIERAWRAGAALAGCSAGAMALGRRTMSMRGGPVEGLGLAGSIATIPHFDRFGFATRIAGALLRNRTGAEDTVLGVDEDTAVLWRPQDTTWTVRGAAKAWLVTRVGGKGQGFADGQTVPLPQPATSRDTRERPG